MKRLLFCCVVPILLSYGCKPHEETITADQVAFRKDATAYLIHKNSQDTLQQLDVELADTDYRIHIGLKYKDKVHTDQGMLFVFQNEAPRSFYIKNTPVPLDVIFITSDHEVDSYQRNIAPEEDTLIESKGSVSYVLEVKAGMVDQWNLEVGDYVKWSENK